MSGLSPTEINAAALQTAVTALQGRTATVEDMMWLADRFADYIRTGKAPAQSRSW